MLVFRILHIKKVLINNTIYKDINNGRILNMSDSDFNLNCLCCTLGKPFPEV